MAHGNEKLTIQEIWREYKQEVLFFCILSVLVVLGHWASRFIPVEFLDETILPIQHSANITVCFVGAFLLFAHSDGIRARKSYAWALLAWGIADSAILVQDYLFDMPILRIGSEALDAYILFIGNFLGWLLLVYPTETLRPGWLTWKRALLQLLPMVALVALDFAIPYDLRWLIALYPVALFVFVLTLIHAYRLVIEDYYSSMDHIDTQWLVRYLMMTILIGLSYIYICLSDNPGRVVTQNALVFFFFAYSIEQILFREDPWSKMQSDDPQSEIEQVPQAAEQLTQWMSEAKPYLNPNFRLIDLREVLPMNRTYLSQFIHDEFDCTFYQFVNNYRIEEAKRLMQESPEMTIEEVATKCGFASRSSFTQTFTKQTGVSPREWSKQC